MPQLIVMGSGDQETQQNIIVPPIFAEMFRFLLGRDVCLLQSGFFSDTSSNEVYNKPKEYGRNFDIDARGADYITIDKGLALIYGYFVYNDTMHTFSVQPPSAGNKFVWIYIRLDLSNTSVADCTLDIFDKGNDSGYWDEAEVDNLIVNPNGKYVLPLYRVEIQPDGSIVNILSADALATQRGKNISVQTMVEISKLSRLADESKWVRELTSDVNATEFNVGYTVVGGTNVGNKVVRMEYEV